MNTSRSQNGFSIVPALFLLVVLGILGAVVIRISMVSQQTVVLTMQATRAYAAARTGIEHASYRAVNGGSCSSATLSLSEGGLNGFTVTTSCTSSTHTEGPITVTVYRLESFASAGAYGSPDYVSRRLRATVSDAS